MIFASARDICRSALNSKQVEIEGIDKPVEVRGLSQSQVAALQEISQSGNAHLLNAWLIKQCCPAFRWWSLKKIHRQLGLPVSLKLVREIAEFSGVTATAVEDAAKNSESVPGASSS